MSFYELLEYSPVIAAIKDEQGLERCLSSECQIIFVLYGNICTIPGIVQRLKSHNKIVIVHADLIQGLSSREIAVDFLRSQTQMDGILSTKPALIRRAGELRCYSILRAFIIDSLALSNLGNQIEQCHPDAVEIMPGIMPGIISQIQAYTHIPLITGGLISAKSDITSALQAGADAVSTTRWELWDL